MTAATASIVTLAVTLVLSIVAEARRERAADRRDERRRADERRAPYIESEREALHRLSDLLAALSVAEGAQAPGSEIIRLMQECERFAYRSSDVELHELVRAKSLTDIDAVHARVGYLLRTPPEDRRPD